MLHNILLVNKDCILDQFLIDCHLRPMQEEEFAPRADGDPFLPPRLMGLVSKERALLDGNVAREDLLDYLIHLQNINYMSRHLVGPLH